MGQNCRANDVDTRRMRTPSLSSHEIIVQRNAQKRRRWKIMDTLLCRWGYDWNCFSHNHFCQSVSVFTGQSEKRVKNVKPAMSEQGDLFWQDNLTHCLCQVWWRHTYIWPMFLRKEEDLSQRYQERVEKLSQQDRLSKICTDAGFLTTFEVGQYFMTEDTEEF